MPVFELKESVGANVLELRRALGSVDGRLLARDALAELIAREHTKRAPNGTTVQRWEEGTEPDYESARIMARLAGVSFEQFAFGLGASIAEFPAPLRIPTGLRVAEEIVVRKAGMTQSRDAREAIAEHHAKKAEKAGAPKKRRRAGGAK